jgi:penicillin-insensitive murein endopeptidase
MVPVLDDRGRSVPLPSTPLNKFGYGLEFDKHGRIPGYQIDFEAIARHLSALWIAAEKHNVSIERVIFDLPLLEQVLNTPEGQAVRSTVPFLTTPPWIRHDEHYHVDFGIQCETIKRPR